jgi:hypothetical protein
LFSVNVSTDLVLQSSALVRTSRKENLPTTKEMDFASRRRQVVLGPQHAEASEPVNGISPLANGIDCSASTMALMLVAMYRTAIAGVAAAGDEVLKRQKIVRVRGRCVRGSMASRPDSC